jgi:hypothetical protein
LEDAVPLFGDQASLPHAGVLLAVPLLARHGLIEAFTKVYGSCGGGLKKAVDSGLETARAACVSFRRGPSGFSLPRVLDASTSARSLLPASPSSPEHFCFISFPVSFATAKLAYL